MLICGTLQEAVSLALSNQYVPSQIVQRLENIHEKDVCAIE